MAIKYAVATGNWSATATWNGGTLPTSSDDVYSNTFTVTIDQNVQVLSLQNGATTGVTAGGGFACSTARTIDCSAGAGFVGGGATLLTISGSVTVTLLGAVSTSAAFTTISTGTATVNLTGNITASFAGSTGLQINSGTLNVTGNLTATAGAALFVAGGTLSITGALYSNGSGSTSAYAVNTSTNITIAITITGNVTNTASIGVGIGTNSSGLCTIYGTITTGTVPTLQVNGTGTTYRVTGPFLSGSTGVLPFLTSAPVKIIPITSNEFRFANYISGTSSLYSSDMTSGPAVGDVRNGVSYTYAGVTQTGTLKVPATQYVAAGVLTDNTVGTYDPATDFWNKQTSALTTSGSIGERLKNAATVDTVGAQIAANSI